jgi:hypothetical protein
VIREKGKEDIPGHGRVLGSGLHFLWYRDWVDTRHNNSFYTTPSDCMELFIWPDKNGQLTVSVEVADVMDKALLFAHFETDDIRRRLSRMITDGRIRLDPKKGRYILPVAMNESLRTKHMSVRSIVYEPTTVTDQTPLVVDDIPTITKQTDPVTPRGRKRRSSLSASRR